MLTLNFLGNALNVCHDYRVFECPLKSVTESSAALTSSSFFPGNEATDEKCLAGWHSKYLDAVTLWPLCRTADEQSFRDS